MLRAGETCKLFNATNGEEERDDVDIQVYDPVFPTAEACYSASPTSYKADNSDHLALSFLLWIGI